MADDIRAQNGEIVGIELDLSGTQYQADVQEVSDYLDGNGWGPVAGWRATEAIYNDIPLLFGANDPITDDIDSYDFRSAPYYWVINANTMKVVYTSDFSSGVLAAVSQINAEY